MLTVGDNLSSITLGAGEPLLLQVAFQEADGTPSDLSHRAFVLAFYRAPRAGLASIEGVPSADGTFLRFEVDGSFSEAMYGKVVSYELDERFHSGRKRIASGALTVQADAASIDSFATGPIGDLAVRVVYREADAIGAKLTFEQSVVAYVPPAPTVVTMPAPTVTARPTIMTDGTPQIGETMTGQSGAYTNGSVTSRAWLLGGTAISGASGASYVPQQAGSLVYRETIAGAGGTITSDSDPVAVAAASVTAPVATALPQATNIVERWSPDAIAAPPTDGTPLASYAGVNGVTLTQATAANQPIYKASGAGGKPYISMSGAQAMRIASDPTLAAGIASGNYSVLAFYRHAVPTQYGVVVSLAGGSDFMGVASTANKADETTCGVNFAYGGFGYDGSANSPDIQSIGYIGNTGFNNSFAGCVLNGCVISYNYNSFGAQDGTFGIGYSTPTASLQGELYDVIIWKCRLTPAEMLQAQKWACEKYGQTPRWVTAGRLTVGVGDSQTGGAGVTNPLTDTWFVRSVKALGHKVGTWLNVGQNGAHTDQDLVPFVPGLDPVVSLTGVRCNMTYMEYYNTKNDVNPNGQTQTLNFCAARKSAGWNKIGLLTAYDTFDNPPGRAQYVADLVAGYAAHGVSDIIRIDQDATIGLDGTCPAGTSASTYWHDGVHCNNVGDGVVQSYVQPIIAAWE
jgi:hypothetical protein